MTTQEEPWTKSKNAVVVRYAELTPKGKRILAKLNKILAELERVRLGSQT